MDRGTWLNHGDPDCIHYWYINAEGYAKCKKCLAHRFEGENLFWLQLQGDPNKMKSYIAPRTFTEHATRSFKGESNALVYVPTVQRSRKN